MCPRLKGHNHDETLLLVFEDLDNWKHWSESSRVHCHIHTENGQVLFDIFSQRKDLQ